MKLWHRSKGENFGKTLLAWRHQSTGRFVNKIGSWLLGGFVMGILASILLNTMGLPDSGKYAGRIVFFLVFFFGVVSAFFRNVVYGLHYRITEKALIHIQPFCGLEKLLQPNAEGVRLRWDRVVYLTWEEIKAVQDAEGSITLNLKSDDAVQLQVAPVRSLSVVSGGNALEERTHARGLFGHDPVFDKEAVKLIVQRIREIKKQATGK